MENEEEYYIEKVYDDYGEEKSFIEQMIEYQRLYNECWKEINDLLFADILMYNKCYAHVDENGTVTRVNPLD